MDRLAGTFIYYCLRAIPINRLPSRFVFTIYFFLLWIVGVPHFFFQTFWLLQWSWLFVTCVPIGLVSLEWLHIQMVIVFTLLGCISLYIYIYIYQPCLYDPLAWSILGDGVPFPYQRLKEHYAPTLWFIVASISLPFRPCLNFIIQIFTSHTHSLSDHITAPLFILPHRLPQPREIQNRLFPPLLGNPQVQSLLLLKTRV